MKCSLIRSKDAGKKKRMWACCSATPIVPYTSDESRFISSDTRYVNIKTKPSRSYQETSNRGELLSHEQRDASRRELHYRVDEAMFARHTSDVNWLDEIQSFCRFVGVSLQKRSQSSDTVGAVDVVIRCSAESQKNHVSIQYTGPPSQLIRILLQGTWAFGTHTVVPIGRDGHGAARRALREPLTRCWTTRHTWPCYIWSS